MTDLGPTLLLAMYETAATIRRFEQRAIEQYRLGNIRGYLHPYLGEEAIAVGSIAAIEPDDYIVSTHRGHGHAIAKGHDPRRMMAELFGRETGYCRGRGGSMHVASRTIRNLGANGVVAGGLGIATGAALAIKQRGGPELVVAFCSDGSSANGMWHESLNLAAIQDLPVVFVLENNQYAVSTAPGSSTFRRAPLATGCPASPSTATTRRWCTRRWPSRSGAPAPVKGLRSSSA
jgi:pyruvate dehydrogenase E1 component alpha subunit